MAGAFPWLFSEGAMLATSSNESIADGTFDNEVIEGIIFKLRAKGKFALLGGHGGGLEQNKGSPPVFNCIDHMTLNTGCSMRIQLVYVFNLSFPV